VQRSFSYRSFLFSLISIPFLLHGQGFETDSIPANADSANHYLFKPIVSFSVGVLNFYGDVVNSLNGPAIGNYAGALNLAAYVDRNHYYLANFRMMMGKTGGNSYSYSDLTRNLNFETTLTSFGFSLEYRFGHLFPGDALVRPYISLGIESINFSAKGDLTDANGVTYHYWSDGTIRSVDEDAPDAGSAVNLHRDYNYETDLRLRDQNEFGLGDYNQRSLAFPVEAGFHFRIDPRSAFSLGASYHYTLTDMLDNVAFEGTSIKGNKGNDSYLYAHVAFHYDLFRPKRAPGDQYYAEQAYDPLMFENEDGDAVVDWYDRCPGTPAGVAVDTTGCPLDGDGDGVPDYQDLEPESRPGVWVDPDGTTLTEEEFLARMEYRNKAMKREEVGPYMDMILAEYMTGSVLEIPDRFKPLDTDQDGYLSYDELLKSIDRYFDYQLDLSLEELRDLNEFFFSQ
jgi:hypothetical protein